MFTQTEFAERGEFGFSEQIKPGGEPLGSPVAVFTSTFVNKIDRKGRVSIPAPFRNVLGGPKCDGIFIYKPFEGTRLEGCGFDRMTQMSDSLDLLEQFSDTFDLLQSLFA